MAVPAPLLAEVSAYPGKNCGLNTLVHVLAANMHKVPNAAPGVEELRTAVNVHYGIRVANWAELTRIVQSIKDPVRLEMFLGPVLRKLTEDPKLQTPQPGIGWIPLDADEIASVANKFEIKVEGYATPDAVKQGLRAEILRQNPRLNNNPALLEQEVTRAFQGILADPNHPNYPNKDQFRPEAGLGMVQPAAPIATLKLWNIGGTWKYDIGNAAEMQRHNLAYKGQESLYATDAQRDALRDKIANTILTIPPGETPDLERVFRQFELDNRAQQNPTEKWVEPFRQMAEQLPNMMNPMGIGGKNNFFVFLSSLLSGLINALVSIFPAFQELMKGFRQMNKTPESPLDEDDINQDPNIVKEAKEFAKLSNALASSGEKGKEKAAELNKEWRYHPNTPQVWKKLTDAMIENGELEKADEWLRAQEQKLLNECIVVEKELKNQANTVFPGIARAPDRKALRKAIKSYRGGLKTLEDPIFSYATEQAKQENFQARFNLFQTCSDTMQKIRDKHKEELKTIQDMKQLGSLKGNIEQEIQTAQNTHENTVVITSLQDRLHNVEKEFNELGQKLDSVRNNIVLETAFIGPVVRECSNIVQAYAPAFGRAKQAAVTAATAEEKKLKDAQQAQAAQQAAATRRTHASRRPVRVH